MGTTATFRTALALCVAALAAGCGGSPGKARGTCDSAILITLDTTRIDALSCYGQALDTTPALDRLAAESALYTQCRTVAPITVPSHASMLTGLYPPEHGLRDNGYGSLPPEAVTVAELASEAGLATAAFVAALVLDREAGLDQGFDLYDQPDRPAQRRGNHFVERPAEEMVDLALDWIEARGEERFLLWLHLFDPHAPWAQGRRGAELSARFAAAGARADYLADVAAVDAELGRLFERLRSQGRLEDTAIVLVADHGEDLMDHGEATHSALVYDTTVRVPLMIRYPDGFGAGTRSASTVSVIDVAPTLCAALGIPSGDSNRPSLARSLWRAEAALDRMVYFESWVGYLNYGWAPLVGVAGHGHKCIHDGEQTELYGILNDPFERDDLRQGTARPGAEPWLAALGEVLARPSIDRAAREGLARGPGGSDEVTERRLEELAALGYATAAGRETLLPSPLAPSGRPRAADSMRELADYLEARDLMVEGDLRAAVDLLDRIVQQNPRHVAGLDRLAHCFVLVQGWPEAIELYEQRLGIAEGPGTTYVNLALAYEQTGRLQDALRALERAIELSPASRTARSNLERVRAKLE